MISTRAVLVTVWLALAVTSVQGDTPATTETESVVQALDETSFKAFTTSHPRFLTLLYAPWDSQSKKTLSDYVAAAHASKKILQEQGQEQIVFSTVRFVAHFAVNIVNGEGLTRPSRTFVDIGRLYNQSPIVQTIWSWWLPTTTAWHLQSNES